VQLDNNSYFHKWLTQLCSLQPRACFIILGGIALAPAIPPTATHLCVAWYVVCQTYAACLNRSRDSDAIWQVHLRGPLRHCARWGFPGPAREGEIWESNPAVKTSHCKLLLPPGE